MARRKGRTKAKRSRAAEPEPVKLERVSFYITPDLAGRYRDAAYRLNVSQGQIVTDALTWHLAQLEKEHGKFQVHAARAYPRRMPMPTREA